MSRNGHFLLESGYHSDTWFDLDALFVDPAAIAPQVDALAELLRPHYVSAICGPLLVLGTKAADYFASVDIPLVALDRRAFQTWLPSECPLCGSGVPLENRG